MVPTRHDEEKVVGAGLAGATLGSMPSIVAGAVAEHVPQQLMHNNGFIQGLERLGKTRYGLVGGGLGLVASGTYAAHKQGMTARQALPVMAGGGAGDAMGGLAGMRAGQLMVNAAAHGIHNPGLRIAGSIAGAIAGDTAGGAAGNLIGGNVAAHMKTMQKHAMTLSAEAPTTLVRAAKHFRIPDMSADVIKKAAETWHPNGGAMAKKYMVPPASKINQFVL